MEKRDIINLFREIETKNIYVIIKVGKEQCQIRLSDNTLTPKKLENNEILFSSNAKIWKKDEIGNLLNLLRVQSLVMPNGAVIQYGQLIETFPLLNKTYDIRGFYGDYKRMLIFLAKKTRRVSYLKILATQVYIALAFPHEAKVEYFRCDFEEKGTAIPVFTDSDECDMFVKSDFYKKMVEKDAGIKKYVPLLVKCSDIKKSGYKTDTIFINPASIEIKGKGLSFALTNKIFKMCE